MDELQLKHIVGYLPYGLQLYTEGKGITTLNGTQQSLSETGINQLISQRNIKPLLLPLIFMLEDIICEQFFEDDSEILGDAFSSKQKAKDFINGDIKQICEPFYFGELAYKLHIDIHGLIDAGLALNKNDYINPVDVLKNRKPFQDFPFDTK